MRTYVGERDGAEPAVVVVDRGSAPGIGEIAGFLEELRDFCDEDEAGRLPEADARSWWTGLMAEKEGLVARINASEDIRMAPLRPVDGADTPMSWGHQGPGALRLARSILSHETGRPPDPVVAQRFMEEIVAELPYDRFRLTGDGIRAWLTVTLDPRFAVVDHQAVPPGEGAAAHPALAVTLPDAPVPEMSASAADPTASALVAACEEAWTAIQAHHPEVPPAVMLLGSGVERGRLVKLGHWWGGRWIVDGEPRGEVLLAGEALHLPPAQVFEVLLHEAAHGLNAARGVKDTSRGGRYHNARFVEAAAEVGLTAAPLAPYGYANTTLSPEGAERYEGVVDRLGEAMRLARQLEPGTRVGAEGTTAESQARGAGVSRSRTAALAQCGCGRKLRMAPTVLASGPVLCGLCDAEFTSGPQPRRTRVEQEADAVVDRTFLARRQAAVTVSSDGGTQRARAVLERQWATLDAALTGAEGAGAAHLAPIRQRRELVRVLLEELGGDTPEVTAGLTDTQRDGVGELLAEAPDDNVGQWYERFGTSSEEPMAACPEAAARRSRLARALLKADGTLAGPAVELDGREFMAGDRVVVAGNDPSGDIPEGVLGTVEAVYAAEEAVGVDFATLGRLKVNLTDSLARRLRHDYVSPDPTPPPPSPGALGREAERSGLDLPW